MGLKHGYKSLKPDPPDATIIGASKWNADHFYIDAAGNPIGNVGALLYSGAIGAITQIDSVAVGQVLASAGAGVVPAWSASPLLTSIRFAGGITIDGSEIGMLDGVTPGVVVPSKIVAVDANRDIASFRNLTADGIITTPILNGVANILEQRNGANPQTFRVYNVDGVNSEFGVVRWVSNEFRIGTHKTGTGVARQITFETNGSGRFMFIATGDFVAYADNAYDIGASGVARPRSVFVGTAIVVGASPATTGVIRVPNAQAISSRNAANDADAALIQYTSGNYVQIGGAGVNGVTIPVGGLAIGTNPATSNDIRLRHGAIVAGRDNANTANRTIFDWGNAATNVLTIGDPANGRTTIQGGDLWLSSATSVQIRNGPAAQQLVIYRTTDAGGANFERLEIGADISGIGTNTFSLIQRSQGTGTAISLYIGTMSAARMGFVTGGVTRWLIDGTSGHITANADNTYDFGSATFRPRSAYFGTTITIGPSTLVATAGTIRLENDGNVAKGNITWRNNANTGNIALRLTAGDRIDFHGGSVYPAGYDFRSATGAIVTIADGAVSFSSNPAQTGAIRLVNSTGSIYARNVANTGDIHIANVGADNILYLGNNASGVISLGAAGVPIYPKVHNSQQIGYAALQWLNVYSAGYTSANLAGTLVTNDSQTLALDAVISLGPNTTTGMLVVTVSDATAIYMLNGTSNLTTLVAAYGGATYFSIVAGTAGKVNVYWSAANSRYELENKIANRGFRLVRVGV